MFDPRLFRRKFSGITEDLYASTVAGEVPSHRFTGQTLAEHLPSRWRIVHLSRLFPRTIFAKLPLAVAEPRAILSSTFSCVQCIIMFLACICKSTNKLTPRARYNVAQSSGRKSVNEHRVALRR